MMCGVVFVLLSVICHLAGAKQWNCKIEKEDKFQLDNNIDPDYEGSDRVFEIIESTYKRGSNDNPDKYLTTPEIIQRHGYPAESHTIQTEDGYLLTLHRIPHGRNKKSNRKAVFLQHGLLGSSSDWVILDPGRSLAFILADSGFDVWLGNARGNSYSTGHVRLDPNDPEYWNFTWHEMGVHDLPAAIDYILEKSRKPKLIYIGHSMGTTMFFVMSSMKPEYGAKITSMFALAPVAYMKHLKSPIRLLAPFTYNLEVTLTVLGRKAFLQDNEFMKFIGNKVCPSFPGIEKICRNLVFLLSGFDSDQFNMTLLPVILGHSPAPTSTRAVIHYGQEIRSEGKFQRFDYGEKMNMIIYGNVKPPAYNLTNIRTPISVHYASNDWLASTTDVERLYEQLPRKNGKYLIPYAEFNHIDFLWANDVKTLVYDDILKMLGSTST